jgi:hypothetical protein
MVDGRHNLVGELNMDLLPEGFVAGSGSALCQCLQYDSGVRIVPLMAISAVFGEKGEHIGLVVQFQSGIWDGARRRVITPDHSARHEPKNENERRENECSHDG